MGDTSEARPEQEEKNFIYWDYGGHGEAATKERDERAKMYNQYLSEHPWYFEKPYETVKSQVYFAFMQKAKPEVIEYFFGQKDRMVSVDMECYRMLAQLYSLYAVRSALIDHPGTVTMEEIHRFIYQQEILLHPDQMETGPLTEKNHQVLDELLQAVLKNVEVRDQCSQKAARMAEQLQELKECFHQKEIEYLNTIADLKEKATSAEKSLRMHDEMTELRIENEKLKVLKSREEELGNLKSALERKQKEIRSLNARISELSSEKKRSRLFKRKDTKIMKETAAEERREKEECKKIMDKIMRDPSISTEQLAFVKQCYEEGMAAGELDYFTVAGIPKDKLQVMKEVLLYGREEQQDYG